jgi:CheY-like chemotaxis protein
VSAGVRPVFVGTARGLQFAKLSPEAGRRNRDSNRVSPNRSVILVVDHEPTIIDIVSVVLQQLGRTTWTASSGREALETVRQYPGEVDLVLLDVGMPEMDGPATWAALKTIDPGLRCCYMTGGSIVYTPAQLLATGAEDILLKPFTRTAIARVLARPVLPLKTT